MILFAHEQNTEWQIIHMNWQENSKLIILDIFFFFKCYLFATEGFVFFFILFFFILVTVHIFIFSVMTTCISSELSQNNKWSGYYKLVCHGHYRIVHSYKTICTQVESIYFHTISIFYIMLGAILSNNC